MNIQVTEDFEIKQVAISSSVPTRLSTLVGDMRNGMRIKNVTGNDIIYLGKVNLTTSNGYPLAADEIVELPINKANLLYALATTNNQKLALVIA